MLRGRACRRRHRLICPGFYGSTRRKRGRPMRRNEQRAVSGRRRRRVPLPVLQGGPDASAAGAADAKLQSRGPPGRLESDFRRVPGGFPRAPTAQPPSQALLRFDRQHGADPPRGGCGGANAKTPLNTQEIGIMSKKILVAACAACAMSLAAVTMAFGPAKPQTTAPSAGCACCSCDPCGCDDRSCCGCGDSCGCGDPVKTD